MQTSAISLRVADFLRQHAPFDSVPQDDLLALSSRGRVRFHESEEFVYWHNARLNPFVYVVQRGAVSLVLEAEGGEQLLDLVGPGDLFGVERFAGASAYRSSARTNCDVVLYAFHADDFTTLLERHPHIARFLSTHAQAEAALPGAAVPSAQLLSDLLPPAAPRVCRLADPVGEAAQLLRDNAGEAVAVVDAAGLPAGVLTARSLLHLPSPDQACSSLLRSHPVLLSLDTPAADALLALADSPEAAGLVTRDGSADSPVLAAVTAASLAASLSAHPHTFLAQIAAAPDLPCIHWLHRRARQAMLRVLDSPADIDWLSRFALLLNRTILKRLLELTGAHRLAACWCFAGSAGRAECLTLAAPPLAVIPERPLPPEAVALLRRAISEAGYCGEVVLSEGSLDDWRQRFSAWISNPIASGIERATHWFDLLPAAGDTAPWSQLAAHVAQELRANPSFTLLLANDALSNLPPLTFVDDAVVDDAGRRSHRFEIEHTALTPIVNVARLFGAATGSPLGFSTLERLRAGNAGDAADNAFRTLLFHQARSGLKHQNEGLSLAPSELGRLDRLGLKAAFRAVDQLRITAGDLSRLGAA